MDQSYYDTGLSLGWDGQPRMAVPANLVNKLRQVAAEMLISYHSFSLEQLNIYNCISGFGRHRSPNNPQEDRIAMPYEVAFVFKVPGVIRNLRTTDSSKRHSFLCGKMACKYRLPPIAPYLRVPQSRGDTKGRIWLSRQQCVFVCVHSC
jgi:hypothetical protein